MLRTEDFSVYAVRDGNSIFIADVPRGLACDCVCVRCGKSLIAKKGNKRSHHFAHYQATECRGSAETILHLLAKDIISKLSSFSVPKYEFKKQRITKTGVTIKHEALILKGGAAPVHRVRIESWEDGFRPDIIIESGNKSLIVEVAVSHRVQRSKLRKMRRRGLPAIEVRLDRGDANLHPDLLREKLQNDLASKSWLFHPDQRKEEREFFRKLRGEISSGRKKSLIQLPVVRRLSPKARASMNPIPAQSSFHELSRAQLNECDRTAEKFFKDHGRWPNRVECVLFWPQLWKKS